VTRAAGSSFLAAALLAAACSSNGLQGTVDSIAGDVEALFGASSPPAKYLAELGAIHDGSWGFRPDVESPLQRTRDAVRALGTCDFATWGETGYTIQLLARMAEEHPSSLVRAEALDTLTKLATWTFSAYEPVPQATSHADMIESLKVLKTADRKNDTDAELTAQVRGAVTAVGAYAFDRVELAPLDRADRRASARAYAERLRIARGTLRSLAGPSLAGFEADPGVREALDRAYVALSGSVIRLSMLRSVLGDPAEATRTAAAHDIAVLVVPDAAPVLRTVLIFDDFASVRREAAVALAAYPREAVVPILIEGLGDEMADVRGAAGRSLETVTGETFGDDRAAWVRWWQANGAPKTAPGASR
jgi:hypothetical protein